MSPEKTIYPALDRFFDRMTDGANACCMGREKFRRVLKGDEEFTPQQKKAIVADIMARMFVGEIQQDEDINMMTLYLAYNGQFDQLFKVES